MSDVEVIRERLHYVSDPIVRSAMQGALSRLEEQLQAAETRIATQTAVIEDQGRNIAEVVQEAWEDREELGRLKEQLETARDKLSRAVVQCLEREKELRSEWDAMYEGLEEIVACRYHTDGIAEALLASLPARANPESSEREVASGDDAVVASRSSSASRSEASSPAKTPCPTCHGHGRMYPEKKGDYRPVADIGCPDCGGTGVEQSPAKRPA